MGFLKSKQRSTNMEQPWVNATFKPAAESLIKQGQQGLGSYMGILTGQDSGAGYDTYRKSTGYQNIFDEAMRGVTGSAAARGLLASGSTARALQNRAGQLAQQNFGNYLTQLLSGANAGLSAGMNAGNTVANVGSQNERVGGLGRIGQIASGIGGALSVFSDPRLKEDIELVEERPGEPDLYRFRYKGDDEWHIGVMADEVAALRPDALGPVVDGFLTVDYEKL
jgi:hypothetical protein